MEVRFGSDDAMLVAEVPAGADASVWLGVLGSAMRYGGIGCAQSVIDETARLVRDTADAVAQFEKGEAFVGNRPATGETRQRLADLRVQYAGLRAACPMFDNQIRAALDRIETAALAVAQDDARLSRIQIADSVDAYFDVKAPVDPSTRDLRSGTPPRLKPTVALRMGEAMRVIDSKYHDWTGSPQGHGSATARQAQRRSQVDRYSRYRASVRRFAALDPVLHRVEPVARDAPSIDVRVFEALAGAWDNSRRLDAHVQRRAGALARLQARLDRAFEEEGRNTGVPQLVTIGVYRETLEDLADGTRQYSKGAAARERHDGTGVWAYPALIQRTMNLLGIDEREPVRSAASEVTLGPESSLLEGAAEMLALVGLGMLASGAGAPVGVAVEVISNGMLAARDMLKVLERQAREAFGAGFALDPQDSYLPRLEAVSDAALAVGAAGTTFPYAHVIPGRFGTLLGLVAPLAAAWLTVPSARVEAP